MSILSAIEMQSMLARQDDVSRMESSRRDTVRKKERDNLRKMRSESLHSANSVNEPKSEDQVSSLSHNDEELLRYGKYRKDTNNSGSSHNKVHYYTDRNIGRRVDIRT